ncbi:unnamed protein product [Didymodactylos carnosus]|uniref:Uncharacterized protein n=1 Tax=Didymodactylos carnosus TaxID=1234261 RepID=A0A815ID65_9BILA|nr:unnamed protein product [Didymodactylos carnosus]CAF4245299.1 unnamed protein product [Didymodactylos carnosus]
MKNAEYQHNDVHLYFKQLVHFKTYPSQSDSNELLSPSVNSSIFSSPTLTSSYVGENSQQSLTKKVSKTAVSTNDPITDDVMEGSGGGGDEVEQEQLIQPETSDGAASEELVPQERISPHSQPVFEEDVVCIEESSTAPIIDRKPFVQLVLSNKPRLYTNEQLDDLLNAIVFAKAMNSVMNGAVLLPFKYLIPSDDMKPPIPSSINDHSPPPTLPARREVRTNTFPFTMTTLSSSIRTEHRSRSPITAATRPIDMHRSTGTTSHISTVAPQRIQRQASSLSDRQSNCNHQPQISGRQRPATLTDVTNFNEGDIEQHYEPKRRMPPITAQTASVLQDAKDLIRRMHNNLDKEFGPET